MLVKLGCGTALPSLAMFRWIMAADAHRVPSSFILADYNPSVIELVTLPNFVLTWAFHHQEIPAVKDGFTKDAELELSPEILRLFQESLLQNEIMISFISGAWSPEFVQLLYDIPTPVNETTSQPNTLVLGAETIYSPFALEAFATTVFSILERERDAQSSDASAYVAAKRLYFGVGGSLDDFIDKARAHGSHVTGLREETEGVRRGVVHCQLKALGDGAD